MAKRIVITTCITFIILVTAVSLYWQHSPRVLSAPKIISPQAATPTPFIFTTYTPVKIEKKEVYKIAMIGDSMTAALGPHGGELSEYMNSLYKVGNDSSQRIIIDNYAISSNILAVDNQLNKVFSVSEYTFGPLLQEDYDVILVESFGYNPLSQFGITGGLQRQTQALDALMTELIEKRPDAVIIFVTTIAPNIKSYGQSTQVNMTAEDRGKLAEERIQYLKNHIAYATKHTIPLINIYEKSLTGEGDGNKIYINPTDNIHPSFAGIAFIKKEIGDFIYSKRILPL